VFLRGSVLTILCATFVAASALGATAIRGKNAGNRPVADSAKPVDPASTLSVVAPPAPPPVDSATVNQPSVMAQGEPVTPQPPLVPVVPEGQSPLADGITALRTDGAVMLSFDLTGKRTRIPERFEQLVRATLPAIYGAKADSILDRLPTGSIASQGNLIAELPTRGVQLPVSDLWAIRLYPETRPGQDGPLVIRYRVSVEPTGK
jgi:hypothetical protein